METMNEQLKAHGSGCSEQFTNTQRTGGVAQVVEHLLCKHKALNSNPVPTKDNNSNNNNKNPNTKKQHTQAHGMW
jgi:hypothetical protein